MDDQLKRLGESLPRLEDPAFVFGEWRGGDRRADGAITMPYFELSEEGLAVVGALPVLVFDWPTWMATDEAIRLRTDPAAIATATPEQLIKLTTALVRGDRFTEGNLAAAFESGTLTAIARRARDLTSSGEILRLHDDTHTGER